MANFDTFIQSLRQEPNYGRDFEVFVKWFLKNDPEWSTQVDEVWLWDDWPDKWGPDCGVDLVFRHRNGDIWAVQAKCYDPSYSVSKKSIDSFLSESSRAIIDHRLLVTSTGLINRNAERTCAEQDKRVTLYRLQDFQRAKINYPASFADLWEAKPEPKPEPRDHQLQAIEAVTKAFEDHDRGQMIMACGTGKTFTTLWIKERLEADTALVLLPSLNLLSQTLREWTSACNQPFEALCVCSDQSVGRRAADAREDLKVSEFAFPVTADVAEIRSFLQTDRPKVVFCTYQSSALIAEAHSNEDIQPFDLAVADEAHRCAGDKAGAFATILDENRIRSNKRLFTTATPRIYANSVTKRAEDRGVEIVGMDDPEVFGPELHRLTFGEAIKRDLLTDYQVVIVGVDEPMIADWIDQGELLQLKPDMATDARSLAAKIALVKAIRDYDLNRVISFHSRVNAAKLFSEEVSGIASFLPEEDRPTGTMWSDYVSGEMQTSERSTKIAKLKALAEGQRGILTNARCLSEGVDVPALDGIAFIDPRASQVDIIQAVGRAIRRSEGKRVGTIVLPVFIEPGDDPDEQIDASAFKPVWEVLKALRAHDEVLADALDRYRTDMGIKGAAKVATKPDKIVFDLPQTVDASFSDALETRLVEQTTNSWNFWFGLLEAYLAREGHCFVPKSHRERGYNLGGWVGTQRQSKDQLPTDCVDRLNRIGFVWNTKEAAWTEGFKKLKQFHFREGHCRVPLKHQEDEFSLGTWVRVQRDSKNKLSQERFEKLEALGFVWNSQDEKWEKGLKKLKQFHSREGHCRVPAKHKEDNFNLGAWVSNWRRNADQLSKRRHRRLEELGFIWNIRDEKWGQGLEKLRQFYSREGHCNVPQQHREDGFGLGIWVSNQRTYEDKLSPERRETLDAVGFIWNTLDHEWERGFGNLQQYRYREGHCNVPYQHQEGDFKLGLWVTYQRARKDDLSPERCERLEKLGFTWNTHDYAWQKGFKMLQQFHSREGHCNVPQQHQEDGFQLGRWVSKQRGKRKKLGHDRLVKLNSLGFVWNSRT